MQDWFTYELLTSNSPHYAAVMNPSWNTSEELLKACNYLEDHGKMANVNALLNLGATHTDIEVCHAAIHAALTIMAKYDVRVQPKTL